MAAPFRKLEDQLYAEAKALQAGSIPFAGTSYTGAVATYTSHDAWDRALDRQLSWGTKINYREKVGDLTDSSLIVAAYRFLSNVLPEPDLKVWEKDASGIETDVKDHDLPKLWNRPNPYYSGSTLKKGLAFSWVLAGQCFLLKFKNTGNTVPLELWYEPHWTIRPVWEVNGKEFISHYQVNRNGQWYDVDVENVIHIRDGLSPYNQRIGFSVVDSVLREIFADSEAANYYASLLGGAAVPPFLIGIDKDIQMSQPEMEEYMDYLKRKTTGPRRGEPLATRGARVYKLAFNPHELDLRESRYAAEERFCAAMGIPAVVLELGSGQEHSIYNNVDQAMKRAYRSYVTPMLNHIEEELDIHLLRDFDGEDTERYLKHDLSGIQALQEDENAKAERLAMLYEKGVIMRSEARTPLGMGSSDPTDEDADKVFSKHGTSVEENQEAKEAFKQEKLNKPKEGKPNGNSRVLA